MEKKKQCEMASLSTKILSETIKFFTETLTFLSSLSSNPLSSIFITLYTLILLYFPRIFLNLIFSPILISTAILLSTLLRLGSIQPEERQDFSESLKWITCGTEIESKTKIYSPRPVAVKQKPSFAEQFMVWNVKAPLDVIYEDYEGEDDDNENEKDKLGIEGMVSLKLCYPESDSGSSSSGDWELPENMCFRWDEEERDEGLIEIPLYGKMDMSFDQVEEENLIEIDISPTRDPVSV